MIIVCTCSEISGNSLTEIFTSNRDSSKNHRKNNLTEFLSKFVCQNYWISVFRNLFEKCKIKFKRGHFFAIFGYLSRSSPEPWKTDLIAMPSDPRAWELRRNTVFDYSWGPLFCKVPLILNDFPFLKLQNKGLPL